MRLRRKRQGYRGQSSEIAEGVMPQAEVRPEGMRGEEGPLLTGGRRGEKVADRMCESADLKCLGLAWSWMILVGAKSPLGESWLWGKVGALGSWTCSGQLLGNKSLYPFPHMWKRLAQKLEGSLFEDVFRESFWTSEDYIDGWTLAAVKFCQMMHGGNGGFKRGNAKKAHWRALESVRHRVCSLLSEWKPGLRWGPAQIKEDLEKRDIGYAGEEIGKVEKLSGEQILPSLPPVGRGGSIRLVDWVSASTRRLLENPSLTEVEDVGQPVPRLQGRVNVREGERMHVASLLVERGICKWYPEDEVFEFRGTKVKNGLFGVVKPGRAVGGVETLRVIMNLIPSNALHSVIPGSVHRLPTISQWTSIFLGPGERIEVSQADITSAFYLFELSWEQAMIRPPVTPYVRGFCPWGGVQQ